MMFQKHGLFFAVKAVVILLLVAVALPSPVCAQSDLAARVKIQGPEFGDVLLVRDGNDIIVFGLAGAVPPSSQVTITAGNLPPIETDASFVGKFPIRQGRPLRLAGGAALASATIEVVKAGSGERVTGTFPLNITGPEILQAFRDYQEEAGQVLSGQKEAVEKGMPPHILLDVQAESPGDQPLVGKVLLTQRLVVSGSGENLSASIVDEFEGLSDAGTTPELNSLPPFARAGVYSMPVDINNPDRRYRIYNIETTTFFNGEFLSNGSFFPFVIGDVNSRNKDTINPPLEESPILIPQPTDTLYLVVATDPSQGPARQFGARVLNDISAGVQGDVTVLTNNVLDVPDAPGPNGSAVVKGKADPYAIVTAYLGNDVKSEWLASAQADAAGNFSILIPSRAELNPQTNEFGPYLPTKEVYLNVIDLLSNESATLKPVTTDDKLVIFENPVASETEAAMAVQGRTEPAALVLITGRTKTGTVQYDAGGGKAGDDGRFTLGVRPYYEYQLQITDQAGNTTETPIVIPGDQVTPDPSDLAVSASFPRIRISGKAEPFSSVISFGIELDKVPTDPQVTDTLPAGAFFLGGSNLEFPETTAKADADGNFSLTVPFSVSRWVYLQSVDPAGNSSRFVPVEMVDQNGNPFLKNLVAFDQISVENKPAGAPDRVSGRTINATDGTPVTGLVVAGFAGIQSETDIVIPFVDQITDLVPVDVNGRFTLLVPDRSPASNEFITGFYLVAFLQDENGALRDVGFTFIDEQDDLNRVGPDIFFAPLASDIELIQSGKGSPDIINISRIYPAGTGAGNADLPADALPFIVVLVDENDDDLIDVQSPSVKVLDAKPLNAVKYGSVFFPVPGVQGLDVGDNYWDPETQSVHGRSVVFISLIDAVGNFSPNPLPVYLDVYTQDPVASQISASGNSIFANEGSVESYALVSVFANPDKSGWIAAGQAYVNGGFAITGLSLTQDAVYIAAKDAAGNESNAVRVPVRNPVAGKQFMVLDGLGLIHTPTTTLTSGQLPSDSARAISVAESTVYELLADGRILRVAGQGLVPKLEDQILVDGAFAQDLEVISANPFAAYVLLGNGVILTYGNVPFLGDIESADTPGTRLPLGGGSPLFFLDQNGNGVRDTEDKNGNGLLDISVGVGGVLKTEDTGIPGIAGTAGNGILDQEPLFNPRSIDNGFGWDIARDLELVRDTSGAVKGYVILDGVGVMWPFGNDIGADNVRPKATNGYSLSNQFKAFQLIVQDGKIVDFISLNGMGQLFGLPSDQGGVLGAGPSTDPNTAGFLSADQYGIPYFGFDIARDVEANRADANGDGKVDWKDGFYVLDGFGGIHAIGGADPIEDSPFLGFDIARDLDF